MVYNEGLVERVRAYLTEHFGYEEKKMFGGLCYLINGNMACGVVKDTLMIRVDKEKYEEYLADPETKEMDFTGRTMRGMLYLKESTVIDEIKLKRWVDRSLEYVTGLPPK